MEEIDQYVQQLEADPELRAIKEQLAKLETQIKAVVSEEVWQVLLQWEEAWAHYVTLCIQRLHPASRHTERTSGPDSH